MAPENGSVDLPEEEIARIEKDIARIEKDIGDMFDESEKLTIRVPQEEEQIDFAQYVRPLRVPAENCQEEVMVLVRRHVVTSTGLYLPEHLACNDSNLTRHEVVRIPDGENAEELGFDIGDHVFISVPSGFQKPQVSQPLDTDKNLMLVSNKFIIAVDERPKDEHVKPGDFFKDD